jgi:hypothetical protein
MQGHLPTPPQPPLPDGLAPILGYIAMREPRPLDARAPVEREWWEINDEEEEWTPRHSRVIKATAIVVSLSLLLAGVGTVLDLVLSSH